MKWPAWDSVKVLYAVQTAGQGTDYEQENGGGGLR